MTNFQVYYYLKPFLPRFMQLFLRRKLIYFQMLKHRNNWPINNSDSDVYQKAINWPNNKKFALILTHDVETEKGYSNSLRLAIIEKKLGFKSSFNFVPERYTVSIDFLKQLTQMGFEVGVHGVKHDGKLYSSWTLFKARAIKINKYLKKWKAVGFRSPAMHHNLDWIHLLDIKYDSSTFDIDPFEPQSDGVKTIFPFCVYNSDRTKVYVEVPYTLPQDFTLFILMKNKDISIWKRKLNWIIQKSGMALLITHPDYMNFGDKKFEREEYPVQYYEQFLRYIKSTYRNQYWHVLPKEMAQYCLAIESRPPRIDYLLK